MELKYTSSNGKIVLTIIYKLVELFVLKKMWKLKSKQILYIIFFQEDAQIACKARCFITLTVHFLM